MRPARNCCSRRALCSLDLVNPAKLISVCELSVYHSAEGTAYLRAAPYPPQPSALQPHARPTLARGGACGHPSTVRTNAESQGGKVSPTKHARAAVARRATLAAPAADAPRGAARAARPARALGGSSSKISRKFDPKLGNPSGLSFYKSERTLGNYSPRATPSSPGGLGGDRSHV